MESQFSHPDRSGAEREHDSALAPPSPFTVTIDGRPVSVSPGQSVLEAARALGLDIPTLCYLEKCGPWTSCLVCLVKINGKLVPSCGTKAQPGMAIESETEEVHEARRTALELLFSDHVGDCLSPCHRLCPLGLNIPVMLRQIQAGHLAEAGRTVRGALPLAGVLGRLCHHPCEQGCRRGTWDDPAGIRNLERFLTEWEAGGRKAEERGQRPETEQRPTGPNSSMSLREAVDGKTVAVIGAGPTGLAAAWWLARQGHSVTVFDRHERAGGSLRTLTEAELPALVLERELGLLEQQGIAFRAGFELGRDQTTQELASKFDSLLVVVGEHSPAEAARLGLPLAGGTVLKADPNTCQTPLPKVFAAGSAVKTVKHLVRAMAEGRAAAECVHQFLRGQVPRRLERPFSSVMGRLDRAELRQFLATANSARAVAPCDRCAGFNRQEATTEASRCLHCDCGSSGNCLLQHYAQVYGANANRFRAQRRPFEQIRQPSGVVFEPGKCILCGICVKLTELAREPLGLTFIGRGFDVRVGAPLNHSIEEGLQKVAAECVRQCPTGALGFGQSDDSQR